MFLTCMRLRRIGLYCKFFKFVSSPVLEINMEAGEFVPTVWSLLYVDWRPTHLRPPEPHSSWFVRFFHFPGISSRRSAHKCHWLFIAAPRALLNNIKWLNCPERTGHGGMIKDAQTRHYHGNVLLNPSHCFVASSQRLRVAKHVTIGVLLCCTLSFIKV